MLVHKVYDRGNEVVLTFEHSLLSLSKWEAKTKKAFLATAQKPSDEMIDYYQCMLTSPEHAEEMVYRLDPAQLDSFEAYINDPQGAGHYPPTDDSPPSRERITSDTLYMQMVILEIPFEAQTWHLNRLMMLIAKVSHAKAPPKKENRGSWMARWQEANQKNRERFNSNG